MKGELRIMKSNNRTNQKWVLALSLVIVMVLGTIGTVSAAEFPKGDTIPVGETIDDDVFISGIDVVIDGNVNGMLFANGETITLNGTIVGDALLIGETVIVSESAVVDGNLFIAGADLSIEGEVTGSVFGGSAAFELANTASVGRNLYYGGFSLITSEGAFVGVDLFTGAYQALLSGTVERDLNVGAAAVELNGNIGRNASINVGEVDSSDDATYWMRINPYFSQYVSETVQPGIRVSDDASVGGTLVYTSSVNETKELDAITSGSVIYRTPIPYESQDYHYETEREVRTFDRGFPAGFIAGAAVLRIARSFIKLIVLGALALWLLSKPFKKLVDAAYNEPLTAIGWGFVLAAVGFLAVFIVPLIFVMVGVIIGFLSLGSLLYIWFGIIGAIMLLVFMLFFFVVFTLCRLLAAYMFGKWLMKVLFKQEEKPWLNLLLGVFLYVIIRAIPFVGWLAGLAALLIGSGAFWLVCVKKTAK